MKDSDKSPEEIIQEVINTLVGIIARKLARQHHEEEMRLAEGRRGEAAMNAPGVETEASPVPTVESTR